VKAMRSSLKDLGKRRAAGHEIRLRSAVPGRMRWEVAGLRNRPRTAAAVAVALERMPGILSVEATPRTGRLLVRYDASLTAEAVMAVVEAALYAAAPTPEATEALSHQTTDRRDEAVPIRWAHTDRRNPARAPAAMWRGGYGRRLLLAGFMQVHRMPLRLLGVLFLLWLALVVTMSSTATGVLLVVALVIIPTATAQLLTVRLVRLLVYATGFAVFSVCLGLWIAAQTHWFPSFCMALSSFAWYIGVRALVSRGSRAHPPPASERVPWARQRPWLRADRAAVPAPKTAVGSAPMRGRGAHLLSSHSVTSESGDFQ
jgi:hypothetical protein